MNEMSQGREEYKANEKGDHELTIGATGGGKILERVFWI